MRHKKGKCKKYRKLSPDYNSVKDQVSKGLVYSYGIVIVLGELEFLAYFNN